VPVDAGTAIDAVVHGKTLFVTSWRGFSTYDVSDPLAPKHLHTVSDVRMINEEPQTNGSILLLSNDSSKGTLEVWDVRNPAAPGRVGEYVITGPAAGRDHIWTCVLECAFAYGSHGTILDLSTPSAPTKVGDWRTATRPLRNYHHIEEVAPGKVLVGGLPVVYLDAGADPAAPREITRFEPHSRAVAKPYLLVGGHSPSVPARVDWPHKGADDFVLVSMESPFSGSCSQNSGTLATFDARGWQAKVARGEPAFALVDEYGPEGNGLPTEGRPPANFWGCSSYGFEVHPDYRKTRRVALSAMEHGVRMLTVAAEGSITELGGFVPTGGSSATTRWVTDTVLYSIDLHRGIDVLRYRGLP
jgi:hypothetical protein